MNRKIILAALLGLTMCAVAITATATDKTPITPITAELLEAERPKIEEFLTALFGMPAAVELMDSNDSRDIPFIVRLPVATCSGILHYDSGTLSTRSCVETKGQVQI